MTRIRISTIAWIQSLLLVMSVVTSAPVGAQYSVSAARPATIESIREVTEQKDSGSPLGMIAGGLIGGGLGSLVGGGTGKTVATIVGAVGGGYVGNTMQKNQTHVVWEITVKYDDGTWGSIRQAASPPFRVGERVLITDHGIEPLR